MGAGGVGDPGLVAGHLVAVARLHRAGAQAAKVGAGVGFGEHGGGQDFAAGELRQPLRLLFGRAAAEDQFGGDLGPRAERADADIAARKLFGHDDHAGLGQAEAAEFLGDGQAEDAHLGQRLDDLHRDQLVLQVPVMGEGGDLLVGIAAELVADHLQLVVEAGGAEGGAPVVVAHQRDQAHPRLGGVAMRDQRGGGGAGRGQCHADVLHAGDLALAHRDAAMDLGEVFAEADLEEQRLHLAELALGVDPAGPGAHLAQGFGVGGEPGERVGRELVLFQRRAADLAGDGDLCPQRLARGGEQRFDLGQGRFGQREDVGQQGGLGQGLSVMRHGASPIVQVRHDLGRFKWRGNKNSF